MKPILAALRERRTEIIAQLRKIAPDLTDELVNTDRHIALEERPPRQGEYSRFRKPSGAIVFHIDIIQAPQSHEEFAEAIVNAGYDPFKDKDEVYWNVMRAISHQIKKGLVKEVNGLIGKPDWPDEMFKSE